MKKPFQVHARHMTDNAVRRVSSWPTWDKAEEEAERLRKIPPAYLPDGKILPVYTDVTVHPQLEGLDLAMALIPKRVVTPWGMFPFARGGKP